MMESKVKEIIIKNGIQEPVSEVLIEDPGLRTGMASENKYITVKFQNKGVSELYLFAKMETKNSHHNKMIRILQAFEKEGQFFTEYFPEATKFCEEKGIPELLDIYPKCYYADEKTLILENLVLNNFSLNEGMHDVETAKVALLTLAKHHALSYAMIQESGGAGVFFEKYNYLEYDAGSNPMVKMMLEQMFVKSVVDARKFLEKFDIDGKEEALAKLNATDENQLYDEIMKAVKYSSEDVLVLIHGDYWNNNMMFEKDKETGKILSLKVIDFQVIRYNTPGIDLGLYMFSSLEPEVRKEHLKYLLQFYLDNLISISEDLGHPIQLSFEQLFLQFRKNFKFGYWIFFSANCGPGKDIIKEIDMREVDDLSKYPVLFDKAIQKWIEANPENCKSLVNNIISFTKEYCLLELN